MLGGTAESVATRTQGHSGGGGPQRTKETQQVAPPHAQEPYGVIGAITLMAITATYTVARAARTGAVPR